MHPSVSWGTLHVLNIQVCSGQRGALCMSVPLPVVKGLVYHSSIPGDGREPRKGKLLTWTSPGALSGRRPEGLILRCGFGAVTTYSIY